MRYIAVDGGKFDTKVATFSTTTNELKKFKYRTKISPGTFDDDMLETNTYIVRIDGGDTYKIGYGAKKEAELESNKKTEIHKTCVLAAIAMAIGRDDEKNDNKEDISVVVGVPYQTCIIPEERIEYKNYILPEGKHTVELKCSSEGPIFKVTFVLKRRLVYPESVGVLYVYPEHFQDVSGVIDIGNLNTNNSYCDQFEPKQEFSFTGELGGKILIAGLAQELSFKLGTRCSEDIVARVLTKPYEQRCLTPRSGDQAVTDKSREIIDQYLLNHVNQIKRACDAAQWSTDYMDIAAIGGTSQILTRELKMVFGDDIFIPDHPEFVNVEGFLSRMCAIDNVDITDKVGSR